MDGHSLALAKFVYGGPQFALDTNAGTAIANIDVLADMHGAP
jgi:hypothetical protein